MAAQLFVDRRRDLRVQKRHHVSLHLDHRDRQPQLDQVFGHLEPDEPTAHDHSALDTRSSDPFPDAPAVGNGPKSENSGKVHTRNRRLHGIGSGRKQQPIVMLEGNLARGEIAHLQPAVRPVHPGHLRIETNLDPEPLLEHFGSRHEEALLTFDDPAHVIGQSAVRKGHIRTAVEDDDLGILGKSAGARRAGRTAGHAANDQKPPRLTHVHPC